MKKIFSLFLFTITFAGYMSFSQVGECWKTLQENFFPLSYAGNYSSDINKNIQTYDHNYYKIFYINNLTEMTDNDKKMIVGKIGDRTDQIVAYMSSDGSQVQKIAIRLSPSSPAYKKIDSAGLLFYHLVGIHYTQFDQRNIQAFFAKARQELDITGTKDATLTLRLKPEPWTIKDYLIEKTYNPQTQDITFFISQKNTVDRRVWNCTECGAAISLPPGQNPNEGRSNMQCTPGRGTNHKWREEGQSDIPAPPGSLLDNIAQMDKASRKVREMYR